MTGFTDEHRTWKKRWHLSPAGQHSPWRLAQFLLGFQLSETWSFVHSIWDCLAELSQHSDLANPLTFLNCIPVCNLRLDSGTIWFTHPLVNVLVLGGQVNFYPSLNILSLNPNSHLEVSIRTSFLVLTVLFSDLNLNPSSNSDVTRLTKRMTTGKLFSLSL